MKQYWCTIKFELLGLLITGLITFILKRILPISRRFTPIQINGIWIVVWIMVYALLRKYWMTFMLKKFECCEINRIHSSLVFEGGSLQDEMVEQEMSVMFIEENDRVLELGGNLGRNSLVIASILKNSENLVVFESDPLSADKLKKNRDKNGFKFIIYNKALSKKPLIQNKWITRPLEENEDMPKGWYPIKTMSFSTLLELHPIPFNVLVCDCEGCLYPILKDEPTFLDGFEKVLLENDFWDHPEQEHYVHSRLQELGFKIQYEKDLLVKPFKPRFWQTWVKQ
jgi:FkbM family methyltransferase